MSCDGEDRLRAWAEIADGLYEALRTSAQAVVSIEGRAAILAYEAMTGKNLFRYKEGSQ